jgi:hypothetical protein
MRINPGFRLFRAGLLSLFLLLAGKVVTAQPVVKKQPVEMVQTTDRKVGEVNVRQTGFVVKGVVKDKNSQESIPGVNVLLKGTEIGTITDADGRFTFPRALNPGNVLIVDFIGYEAQEYVVPQDFKAAEILLPISMKASNIILGGICYRPSLPRRLWLKIKSIF